MSGLHRYSNVGERGVKAFLSKPFDVDTLLTVLEDVGNWHDGQSRCASP
jgi:YesN/AraC family two-component response regulator